MVPAIWIDWPGYLPTQSTCSVDLEHKYLGACRSVLGYCHKVAVQFRNQLRGSPQWPRWHLREQLIVVGVRFLVNVNTAVRSGINALAGRVVHRLVYSLRDG